MVNLIKKQTNKEEDLASQKCSVESIGNVNIFGEESKSGTDNVEQSNFTAKFRINRTGQEANNPEFTYENLGGRDQEKEIFSFFEFKFTEISELSSDSKMTLLKIKDITIPVSGQQKMDDKVYQEAIESNYSHEQMTPLNCILQSSFLLKVRFGDKFKKGDLEYTLVN